MEELTNWLLHNKEWIALAIILVGGFITYLAKSNETNETSPLTSNTNTNTLTVNLNAPSDTTHIVNGVYQYSIVDFAAASNP